MKSLCITDQGYEMNRGGRIYLYRKKKLSEASQDKQEEERFWNNFWRRTKIWLIMKKELVVVGLVHFHAHSLLFNFKLKIKKKKKNKKLWSGIKKPSLHSTPHYKLSSFKFSLLVPSLFPSFLPLVFSPFPFSTFAPLFFPIFPLLPSLFFSPKLYPTNYIQNLYKLLLRR